MAYTLTPAPGTISISGVTITGIGTTFTALKMGTLIFAKDIGLVGQLASDPATDLSATLVLAWAGSAVSGKTYGTYLQNDPATYSTLIRSLLQSLASSAIGAFAGLSGGTGDVIGYFTGAAAMATTAFTSFARQLVGATSSVAAQALLGIAPRSGQLDGLGIKFGVAANALTGTVTQPDGSTAPTATAPALVGERSATAASGAFNQRTLAATLTLTLPNGASLGATNGIGDNKYWYLQDNAGTLELAVSGTDYGDSFVASSTTISAGATSGATIYAATGRANVPMRKVAETVDTQATAGTYTSTPTSTQVAPFGGQKSEFFKSLYASATAAAALTTLGAIGAVRYQVFTASGTYTPDAHLIAAHIICVAGGGSGGGVTGTSSTFVASAGGGAGGVSELLATAATIGASQTVTIGAGGAAPTAGTHDGNAGGDTSVGSLCVAKAGSGGSSGAAGSSAGAAGAGGVTAGATGTVKISGGDGGHGSLAISVGSTGSLFGVGDGAGGQNAFSGRASCNPNTGVAVAGKGFGGGGSGCSTNAGSGTVAGGAGASGIVVVMEFCSQ